MANQGTMGTTFEGGGTVEFRHGGQLFIITTQELTPAHVDEMYKSVEGIFNYWTADKPLLFLFDATWGATTPRFRQQILQINAIAMTLPNLTRIACLVQEKYRGEVGLLGTLTGSGNNHRLAVFTERDTALIWLEKELS
jgi:hypothetical protein